MQPLLVRLGLNAKDFNAGFLEARKNLEGIKKNTDDLSKSMQNMNKVAKLAFSAWGIYNVREALQSLVRYVGEVSVGLDRMKRSMSAATGSLSLGAHAMQFLNQESQRLGLLFKDQIKGFQQLTAAAKGTSITYKDVREIFLGISEASTVMQLSTEQNKYALYALQQMISKGVVTMEELRRQLGDQIPGAFQIAARAMNVTTQELIKMVSTGNLISEEFVPRFAKQLRKEMAGSVEDASQSIYANINRLKNEFYILADDIAQSSGGIEVFNNALKEFLKYLKDPETKQAINDFSRGVVVIAQAIEELGKKISQVAKYTGIADMMHDIAIISRGQQAIDLEKTTRQIKSYSDEIEKTREKIKSITDDMNGWPGSLMGKDPFLEMIAKEESKIQDLIKRIDELKKKKDELGGEPRLTGRQVPDDIYGDTTEWDLRVGRIREIIWNYAESTGSSEYQALQKANKEFEVIKKQLSNLKATAEEVNEIEELYAKQVEQFALKRQSIIDKWEALASGNKEDKLLKQREREYNKNKKQLVDLQGDAKELNKLEIAYNKTINDILVENKKKRDAIISKWEAKSEPLKQDAHLAKLKTQFEDKIKQLDDLKANAEELNRVEVAYHKKVADVLDDDSRERRNIIDKWKELSSDLSDEEKAILELERRYIESRNKLINLGGYAKTDELAELKKAFESAKVRATENFKIWQDFMDNVKDLTKDTFADLFKGNIDGWQDMVERMRDIYLDMIAELATKELFKNLKSGFGGQQVQQGQLAQAGQLTNLFGKPSYNYGGAAIGGALMGASSQNQSYLSSAAGGAIQGYMIGGPYGAIAGAAGSLIGKWLFGKDDKPKAPTPSTPAWYDVSTGENKNKPWLGGIGASDLNIRGQFPGWSPFSYQPDYNWFLNPAGTSYKSIELTNEISAKKRELSIQFSNILTKLPDQFASDIISEAADAINGIWSTWELPPGTDSQLIAERFAYEYNKAITSVISDDIQSYLQTSADWGLLDKFTKSSLLKPVFGGPTSTDLQVEYLTNVEDITNLLNYLDQINTEWRNINVTVKQFIGESSNYEIGLNNINDSFDQMIDKLRELGFAQERITEIESQRAKALEYYEQQITKQRDDIIDQWRVLGGIYNEEQAALVDLKNQYEDAYDFLKSLNSDDSYLSSLSDLYDKAIQKIKDSYSDIGDDGSIVQFDKIKDLIEQWKISSGFFNEQEAVFLRLKNQYEDAKKSLEEFGASTEQLDELKYLYEKSIGNIVDDFTKDITDSFSSIQSAWSSFFDNIMNDLSPVQSSAYLGQKLSSLYGMANTEEGITNLLNFVQSEYLPFMKAYGESDYNTIWENIRDLTGNITYNGQIINGIDYNLMGSTIGEYVSAAMSSDNSKIIIQIGDKTYKEIMLSELRNNDPDLISEIRRVING